MKITFGIITLNEATNLERCLNSIKEVADEILIVDSGSTDRSRMISQQFNVRWIEIPWPGYVTQKNNVLQHAIHPWVFSIDADEALSPELLWEIKALKVSSNLGEDISGYSMPRCVFYDQRWIRHGDWYPDRLVRLFRKDCARFTGGRIHERLEIKGRTARLTGEIEHHSFKNQADHWERCQKYAALWAADKFEQGRTTNPLSPLLHAAFRWLRGYVLRCGFLNGRRGWQIAKLSAKEVFLKYRLLRELQTINRRKLDQSPEPNSTK